MLSFFRRARAFIAPTHLVLLVSSGVLASACYDPDIDCCFFGSGFSGTGGGIPLSSDGSLSASSCESHAEFCPDSAVQPLSYYFANDSQLTYLVQTQDGAGGAGGATSAADNSFGGALSQPSPGRIIIDIEPPSAAAALGSPDTGLIGHSSYCNVQPFSHFYQIYQAPKQPYAVYSSADRCDPTTYITSGLSDENGLATVEFQREVTHLNFILETIDMQCVGVTTTDLSYLGSPASPEKLTQWCTTLAKQPL